MAAESTGDVVKTLSTYVDAVDAARQALKTDVTSGGSIRRLAASLERLGQQHGYPTIATTAAALTQASDADLGLASERLLMALLKAVTEPASREQAVLIVDDDVVLTRLLSKVLGHDRRAVLTAGSGAEMLTVLKDRWIDLIILDVGLPDLDGREILTALKRNPLTAMIPVVVLTAGTEAWLEAECRALGATAFLRKPIDPLALAATVALELTRPRQPASAPAPASEPTPPPPPPRPDSPRTGEVLLAEHDPLVAQIIRHRLGREGMTVRHFSSGTAALQAAKGLTPVLVVLDAMTPGIDGIELLRQLRRMEHYQKVPVLVLSDIGSEREVVRALEAGADDCIRKPFSPTELVARIDRLLRRG
ncbi:MAG: response regulator [Gemmatimonadales bacterium]